MRIRAVVAAAALAGGVATASAAAALPGGVATASAADLHVRGNRLLDGSRVVRLLGVNRSGLEYACIQGWGFFDSPHPAQIDDPRMIAAMKSWAIDAVRVPLNEDCWLGVGTRPGYGGAPYRRIVSRYVGALRRAGLYVILDLHWAGAGGGAARAVGQTPMADAARAPAFWRSVARWFRHDHGLVFDLFNEPYGISWSCWLHGCVVPAGGGLPAYRAAGMQALVDAVRSAGARQPLMLGGLSYAGDVSGWRAHEPHDPLGQLIASEHNYGVLGPCLAGCRAAVLSVARRVPVVFGELGETDCADGYINAMMGFADAHGISYLGWAWNATSPGGATCKGEPALITSYDGTPTPFGVGLRDHLRALAAAKFRRSPPAGRR